jgi:hypothetical protein
MLSRQNGGARRGCVSAVALAITGVSLVSRSPERSDVGLVRHGDRERKYGPTGTDDAFRISNDLLEDSIEGLSL